MIEPSLLKTVDPGVVPRIARGTLRKLHVTATHTRARIGWRRKAGIVGLADHDQPEPAVEHVIPGVQGAHGLIITSRQKVTKVMGHVDNGFVRPNAVERRDLIIGELL